MLWLRLRTALALAALLAAGLAAPYARAEDPNAKAAAVEEKSPEQESYEKVAAAYLAGEWDTLEEALKESQRHYSRMTSDQKKEVRYIRSAYKSYRPSWWKNCSNNSAISFKAGIWGKTFMANYMPSGMLGASMPVDVYQGRLRVIVTWKPGLVDSPRPADGSLAKLHHIRKGDIGEAIVWHELGHNYVTVALPLNAIIELYDKYFMLFEHLQEFYAETTSLYHASPKARLAMLMLRLDDLDWYTEDEAHARMAHSIGSLILSKVLDEPEKWPSFHFPGQVPDSEVERNTIVYLYEHIDPNWTLAEDMTLRDTIHDFIRAKGDSILRSKGEVPLFNKLKFKLLATDDRDNQKERDKWVREKLEALIKSGRADPKPKKDDKSTKMTVVDSEGHVIHVMDRGARIEIPW